MALPNATANNLGAINKQFVSAIPYLDQLNVWSKVADLQQDGAWASLMSIMGNVMNDTSNEWWFDTFYNDAKNIVIDTTGATIGGSGTTTVTVTGLTAGNNDYIKVHDTVLLPNKTMGRVTTLTTTTLPNDTFTMVSVDGTALTLVTGNKLTVTGSAFGEGSDAPEPMRFNLTSIRNNIQIFSQTWSITDVQGGALRTVQIDGDYHAYDQGEIDAYQKLQAQFAATFFAGRISADTFATSGAVQTTRGLDQYIETYGVTPGVLTPGQVTTADVSNLESVLVSQKAPYDYMGIGSIEAISTIGVYLNNLASSGAQSVRLMPVGANAEGISFNATRWTSPGGYTFSFRSERVLSNPQMFNYVASGSSTTDFSRGIYLMPNGQCPVYGGTTGDGGTMPYFLMRFCPPTPKMYKQRFGVDGQIPTINGVPANNGQVAVFYEGGFAGTNLSALRKTRLYAQMGVHINLPQRFARWDVL